MEFDFLGFSTHFALTSFWYSGVDHTHILRREKTAISPGTNKDVQYWPAPLIQQDKINAFLNTKSSPETLSVKF